MISFGLLWERPLPVLIVLLPLLLNIYLVGYAWRRMIRSALTDVFIVYLISLIAWQAKDLLDRLAPDRNTAIVIDKILSHGWILSAPLGLHFAIKLLRSSSVKLPKRTLFLIYFPALVFMAMYSPFANPDDYQFIPGFGWINVLKFNSFQAWLLVWYEVVGLITLGFFIAGLVQAPKGTPGHKKFLLITIGYLVPAIQASVTQVFFPVFFHWKQIPLTTTFMSVFSLTALIALRKYKRFNIQDSIGSIELMDNLADIILAINPGNRIVFANMQSANALGYSLSELEEKDIADLVKTEGSFSDQFLNPAHFGRQVQDSETFLIRKNGEMIPVSIVAVPIVNDQIREGILLISRDISNIRKNLEEITRQKTLLQQLFDASPLAMTLLDLDGNVISLNPAFEKMFGFSIQELKDKRLGYYIIPENLQEEARQVWESSFRPGSMHFETKRRTRDGVLLEVSITIYLIRVKKELFGVYSIYEDITQRKQDEYLLLSRNEELTKVNKELDQFVYSMSHDIRAPLMSIKGIVNMAEMDAHRVDDFRMYLDLVKKNVHRLDEFTSNAIRFYKNKKEDIIYEEIHIYKTIKTIIETLRYQDDARDMQFIIQVAEDCVIISDKATIRVIINNLVSNAIKYRKALGSESFLKIGVSVENDCALMTFEDNGEGIDPGMHDKIFHMFTRFSERSAGSGLGLYIVKEMVHKLSGEIMVVSERGSGAKFAVKVPMPHAHPAAN